MSKKVILVTGGQRSGKSGYAQRLALSLSPNPVYLATSRIWDEEFRKRVKRHQRDRGPEWTNIEEEKYLSRHDLTDRVVVIDKSPTTASCRSRNWKCWVRITMKKP